MSKYQLWITLEEYSDDDCENKVCEVEAVKLAELNDRNTGISTFTLAQALAFDAVQKQFGA